MSLAATSRDLSQRGVCRYQPSRKLDVRALMGDGRPFDKVHNRDGRRARIAQMGRLTEHQLTLAAPPG
jgi:hypothetical protein